MLAVLTFFLSLGENDSVISDRKRIRRNLVCELNTELWRVEKFGPQGLWLIQDYSLPNNSYTNLLNLRQCIFYHIKECIFKTYIIRLGNLELFFSFLGYPLLCNKLPWKWLWFIIDYDSVSWLVSLSFGFTWVHSCEHVWHLTLPAGWNTLYLFHVTCHHSVGQIVFFRG